MSVDREPYTPEEQAAFDEWAGRVSRQPPFREVSEPMPPALDDAQTIVVLREFHPLNGPEFPTPAPPRENRIAERGSEFAPFFYLETTIRAATRNSPRSYELLVRASSSWRGHAKDPVMARAACCETVDEGLRIIREILPDAEILGPDEYLALMTARASVMEAAE